jgi:hypothetical protein
VVLGCVAPAERGKAEYPAFRLGLARTWTSHRLSATSAKAQAAPKALPLIESAGFRGGFPGLRTVLVERISESEGVRLGWLTG